MSRNRDQAVDVLRQKPPFHAQSVARATELGSASVAVRQGDIRTGEREPTMKNHAYAHSPGKSLP